MATGLSGHSGVPVLSPVALASKVVRDLAQIHGLVMVDGVVLVRHPRLGDVAWQAVQVIISTDMKWPY